MDTLREDGHAVFHAYDTLSAIQLGYALDPCDLVISNTRFRDGVAGVDLILKLRKHRPHLPILYLANAGRSLPEAEAKLPPDVPILREPFTAEKVRAAVYAILNGGAQAERS